MTRAKELKERLSKTLGENLNKFFNVQQDVIRKMNVSGQDLHIWADIRNTSLPVALAIMELARDLTDADRIWRDPEPDEMAYVRNRAPELDPDNEDLLWGDSELQYLG